jgi:Aspartyl/Asparaginyl beta-hydroxylase
MFLDNDRHPFTRLLEASWEPIEAEMRCMSHASYRSVADGLIQSGTWGGCGLFDATDASRAQSWSPNAARCPHTRATLARIPGLLVAAFLGMAPGTRLRPHVDGQEPRMLHSLLGLAVPPSCWLRVGSEVRACAAGECLVFDPRLEHEAANESTEVRVMLFVEVLLASAHLPPLPPG